MKSKKWIYLLLFILISFVSVLLVEYSLENYKKKNIALKEKNPFDSNCYEWQSYYPHPFWEYIYSKDFPCSPKGINHFGFLSPEFPHNRQSEFFDIVIIGNELADKVLPAELKNILADNYTSEKGREVRVFSLVVPGWKLNQTVFAFNNFSRVFDAVIYIGEERQLTYINPLELIHHKFLKNISVVELNNTEIIDLFKMKELSNKYPMLNNLNIFHYIEFSKNKSLNKKIKENILKTSLYKKMSHTLVGDSYLDKNLILFKTLEQIIKMNKLKSILFVQKELGHKSLNKYFKSSKEEDTEYIFQKIIKDWRLKLKK